MSRDWDAIWIAFKLRYSDTVGITYPFPGGMIRYIQFDDNELIRASPPESLIGRKMIEFGLNPADYHALAAAARKDRT